MTAPLGRRPAFILTVDVEADDMWSRTADRTTTANVSQLGSLHALCLEFGVRPVYLASSEVADITVFRTFMARVLARNEGELGMHLHAWTSPPLTSADLASPRQPRFATEYDQDSLHAKVRGLTTLLTSIAGARPRSHRGGRWALDERYARILVEEGYEVDASVTPGLSWRGKGGQVEPAAPDYTAFPDTPYFLDLERIDRPGHSPLLEVPLTTCRMDFGRRFADGRPAVIVEWLRPTGRNGAAMRRVADVALAESRPCLVAMLHSSDLLAGASPIARDAETARTVMMDLRALMQHVAARTQPMTLAEFRASFERGASVSAFSSLSACE